MNNLNSITSNKAFFKESYLRSQMRLISVLMTSVQKKIMLKMLNICLCDLLQRNFFRPGGYYNILALSANDPFLTEICNFFDQEHLKCTLRISVYENSSPKESNDSKHSVDRLSQGENISYDLCSSCLALSEELIHSFADGLLLDLPTYKDCKGILHVSTLSVLLKISKIKNDELNKIFIECDKALKDNFKVSNHEQECSTLVRFQASGSPAFETVLIANPKSLHFPSIIPSRMIRRSKQTAIVYKMLSKSDWSGMPIECKSHEFSISEKDISNHMLVAYLNRGGGGNSVISAVIDGARCRYSYAEDYRGHTEGVPICWGVLRNSKKILDDAISNDQHFIYIDHAYFDRGHGKSYRISVNSYECNMMKCCPSDRSELLNVSLKPWNTLGSKIIVCPPTEYFSEAHSVHGWLHNTIKEIKLYTDRKIVVRKKPKPGESVISLEEQLKDAYALVTHSSNVAIEAACLGTPVFVSETSAASPVGLTDLSKIETPIYPDRSMWINNLSYCQFNLSEIRSGEFLRIINQYYNFDATPEAKNNHY